VCRQSIARTAHGDDAGGDERLFQHRRELLLLEMGGEVFDLPGTRVDVEHALPRGGIDIGGRDVGDDVGACGNAGAMRRRGGGQSQSGGAATATTRAR
jgi:hypothetical protein